MINSLKSVTPSIEVPKIAADHISAPLCIINTSLFQGVFPDLLKPAQVTPVHKGEGGRGTN